MQVYIVWLDTEVCCHLDPPSGIFTTRELAELACKGHERSGIVECTTDRLYLENNKLWPN